MNRTHLLGSLLAVVIGLAFSYSPAFADATGSASLADIHKLLLQASGEGTDTPPTVAQQTEMLNKALKMIEQVPHVYHRQLKGASQSIETALSELSTGDDLHAKHDILTADDLIKSIM